MQARREEQRADALRRRLDIQHDEARHQDKALERTARESPFAERVLSSAFEKKERDGFTKVAHPLSEALFL